MIKILNLYAGVGGNRMFWGDKHDITAIELNPEIAEIYKDLYPNDTVIVADAHEYLLEHYNEFDFIWSSPPCQSHSRARYWGQGVAKGTIPAIYPDMKLYQEIIFLEHHFKGKFVVENVIPYYEPLIKGLTFASHLWWSNFIISSCNINPEKQHHGNITDLQKRKSIDLTKYKIKNKQQILRNMVEPEIGLHVFNCFLNKQTLFDVA